MAREVIVEHAYFYRFMRNKELLCELEVFEGKVIRIKEKIYQFVYDDEEFSNHFTEGGCWSCSKNEGEIKYGNLWLSEYDVNKAKDLFIRNWRKKIKSLQQEISYIERIIDAV